MPRPLALLIAVGVVLSVAWAVAQPPFQGPDESRHFAYTQRIVEQREIPWYVRGSCRTCTETLSTEVREGLRWSGMAALAGNPAMKDTSLAPDERAWRVRAATLSSNATADGGYQETMRNGPAYYLYEAGPYAVTSGRDVFTRAFAMRLANLPFVVVLIVATWILAGLVAGPRRDLQVLAAGLVALSAQLTSIGGSVNADMLLAAAYAAALALMGLVLVRRASRGRLVGLVALAALAALTHPRGVALFAPVALTAVIAWWRERGPRGERGQRLAWGAGAATAAVAAGATLWAATLGRPGPAEVREFGSYLWQFYLPRLGFMDPVQRSDWNWRDVFVDRFWGVFSQFDVIVAPWLLDVMAVATVVGLLALAFILVLRRRALRSAGAVAAVLTVAFLSYLGAVHVSAWRLLSQGGTDPILTGRYFLPFLPLLGLAAVVLVRWLPRRARAVAGVAVLSAALALQLAALGALVVRYHA